jgi:hypothetical protein
MTTAVVEHAITKDSPRYDPLYRRLLAAVHAGALDKAVLQGLTRGRMTHAEASSILSDLKAKGY